MVGFFFNNFKIYLNLFYFLAALGLCCCARAFSSCSERGLLCCGVLASHCGFSLWRAGATFAAEHGL